MMESEHCSNEPHISSKRRLATGEEFYTNYPRAGFNHPKQGLITLEAYLGGLRSQFSSVQVSELAIDSTGRQLENDVAIFVKK